MKRKLLVAAAIAGVFSVGGVAVAQNSDNGGPGYGPGYYGMGPGMMYGYGGGYGPGYYGMGPGMMWGYGGGYGHGYYGMGPGMMYGYGGYGPGYGYDQNLTEAQQKKLFAIRQEYAQKMFDLATQMRQQVDGVLGQSSTGGGQ